MFIYITHTESLKVIRKYFNMSQSLIEVKELVKNFTLTIAGEATKAEVIVLDELST